MKAPRRLQSFLIPLLVLFIFGIVFFGGRSPIFEGTDKPILQASERGRQLYLQFDCKSCHDPVSPMRAPILKSLLGSERSLADEAKIKIDRAYLRRSIMEPKAQIVRGYSGTMPQYKEKLNSFELDDLVAYIESL